mgnify:FL=1
MTEGKRQTDHGGRGSFFGPILLIVIGGVFLARNLEVISGGAWEILINLWPALLIIAGLDDLFRRRSFAWPVLLIGAGALLLLNNFGPRTIVTWTKILPLWPLILIAFGIDLLFQSRTWWGTMTSILLVVILVGGAVWWIGFQGAVPSGAAYPLRRALSPDIRNVKIQYSLGAGQLIVGDISESDVLAAGTAFPEKPDQEYSEEGSAASYSLEMDFPTFYPNMTQWELGITPEIPVSLMVDNGAGELFLALEGLALETLQVEQGVGDIVIRLPAEMEGDVIVDQAVGRTQILVPADAGIRIHFEKALSRLDVPDGYRLQGNTYTSPGFTGEQETITIHVEQAVGIIKVQIAD